MDSCDGPFDFQSKLEINQIYTKSKSIFIFELFMNFSWNFFACRMKKANPPSNCGINFDILATDLRHSLPWAINASFQSIFPAWVLQVEKKE